MMKNYFAVDAFRASKKFEHLNEAETYYKELVNKGFSYVELKVCTETERYYYASSIKIFHK